MNSSDDELAALYARMLVTANHAGRALHDEVGPSLSAAGLHLQLLRMDHPQMEREIERISGILDQAFERIRAVSQALAPSPVLRGGLKNALERLAESTAAAHPGLAFKLSYKIAGQLPVEAACALFEAVYAGVTTAVSGFAASRIAIAARGARLGAGRAAKVSIRIVDNGRTSGRAKALRAARLVAEAQGLSLTLATKQDTIVFIRYALRRPAGR